MKKRLLSLGFCLLSFSLLAETQPLWPEGKIPDFQERQVAARKSQVAAKGFDASAHRMPYLEWAEKPAKPNGTCVIIIPGGGYTCVSDGKTFDEFERILRENGVTCVSLCYRTPRPQGLPIYQSAWEDGQRAVRLVRAAAQERGFDPEKIGALGVSAGSHLTVLLGTNSQKPAYAKVDETDDLPCHLNFAIPICVAYALTDGLTAPNAKAGDAPEVKLDSIFKFSKKSCPMCLFHGGNDPYSPLGSTQIYRMLRRNGVPAELHLDPDRGHEFGDVKKFDRAIEFLRQMGFLDPLEPSVELMKRYSSNAARAIREKEPVWPEGKMPDVQTNQCIPYLEWHIPSNLTTKAIQIIYSGGSYMGNDPDGFEVAPFRRYLNEKGMAVVTMKYRTPRPKDLAKHVTAWQDLQRVIRIVRSKAAAKGFDPDRIGIMGSSAGGHLTLMGATSSTVPAYGAIDELDKISCKANWAVAIYPAYALTDGLSWENKTGGNDDSAVLAHEFAFDSATCPILFIHGDADKFAAMNSVKCWEQLRRMGIQGELHTLAKRFHCFQSLAAPGTGSYTWMDRIWEFMTKKGYNK